MKKLFVYPYNPIINTPLNRAYRLLFRKPGHPLFKEPQIFAANTGGDDDLPPPPEEHDKDPAPPPRPFPDPGRQPDNAANTRIFALLVGINDYPAPVPKLGGCLKDVEQIEHYLRGKYGDPEGKSKVETLNGPTALTVETDGRLHLCTLKNSQATYPNIIRGFREHLGKATGKDTVWFHFSGHGAEQFTADEFFKNTDGSGNVASLAPNGKDQTLVCYRDESAGGPLYLADKELAVLLHEVASGRSMEGQKPHIVVSLDCCHSGSGTRDTDEPAGFQVRNYDPNAGKSRGEAALEPGAIRNLGSYIDGFYARQRRLEVPVAPHVLLSACESVQLAGDLPEGGVFTTSLIKALKDAEADGRSLHYASLFTKTRARARRIRNEQNPQFETIGGFDPYSCFLEGWPLGKPGAYEVFHKDGNWFVRCGAIHGLPLRAQEATKIRILNGNTGELACNGYVDKAGAQHSKVRLLEEGKLNSEGEYVAEILFLPALPEYVNVHGHEATANALKEAWDDQMNIKLTTNGEDEEKPSIEVEATNTGAFILRDLENGWRLIDVPAATGNMDERVQAVKGHLDKVVRWKRMIELDNQASRIRNLFEFELAVLDRKNKPNMAFYKGNEITLPVTEEHLFDNNKLAFKFRATLKEAGQDLYFYLFDLSPKCGITFMNDEEAAMRASELNAGAATDLRQSYFGWGPDPGEQSVTRWFKLLATTEELDYHQLTQPELMGNRGVDFDFNPDAVSEDWCAVTMKVTVEREEGC
ncbi:MAG: caspase family protein [Lewinellaceae bacterium]|nr:caspase family protein [Lewinellaceae bacterium]